MLVGRCVSYGEGATWLPLAEMLEQAGERLDDDPGRRRISRRGLPRAAPRFRAAGRRAAARPRLRRRALGRADAARPRRVSRRARGGSDPLPLPRPHRSCSRCARRWPTGRSSSGRLPTSRPRSSLRGAEPELREQLVETAGGNPLFLEQLLAYASEDGESRHRAAFRRVTDRGPPRPAGPGGARTAPARWPSSGGCSSEPTSRRLAGASSCCRSWKRRGS